MDDPKAKIKATHVYYAQDYSVQALKVQPGNLVQYSFFTDPYSQFLNHEPRRKTIVDNALVSKIELMTEARSGLNSGAWLISLEGIGAIHQGDIDAVVGWSAYKPQVMQGETYEIEIVDLPFFARMKKRLVGVDESKYLKTIVAQVLTQSSLTANSLVYLIDEHQKNVYATTTDQLPKRESSRVFVVPDSYEIIQNNAEQLGFLDLSLRSSPSVPRQQPSSPLSKENPRIKTAHLTITPQEIYAKLTATVKGQERAAKDFSVALTDHIMRGNLKGKTIKKSNVLIVGPTATGKTEIARTGSEILDVPFAESKLAGKTSTGYIGTNMETVFLELQKFSNHPRLNYAEIFLDEIDKLAPSREGNDRIGFGDQLMNQLIGYVESDLVKVPIDHHATFEVDTTNMLFIAAGAFAGLDGIIAKRLGKKERSSIGFDPGTAGRIPDRKEIEDYNAYLVELYESLTPDDLIEYGLKPELVGRFPILTYTKPLTQEILIDIMKNGKKSFFNQQVVLLNEGYQCDVSVEEQVYELIAGIALRDGLGARSLEKVTNRLFHNIKFNMGASPNGKSVLNITYDMAKKELIAFDKQ
jgi:ATP-dependent Clp protease ATP-binding subunit ClpX